MNERDLVDLEEQVKKFMNSPTDLTNVSEALFQFAKFAGYNFPLLIKEVRDRDAVIHDLTQDGGIEVGKEQERGWFYDRIRNMLFTANSRKNNVGKFTKEAERLTEHARTLRELEKLVLSRGPRKLEEDLPPARVRLENERLRNLLRGFIENASPVHNSGSGISFYKNLFEKALDGQP